MRSRIDAAVELLVALRAGQQPRPDGFPSDCAPRDESEAYQVQQRLLQRLGTRAGGWKATLFDAAGRGLSAPLDVRFVRHSPASLPPEETATRGTRRFGLEPEVAFTLGTDLPPRAGGYARAEVLDAVASAHAALEVCVCRFADFAKLGALERIADNFINEALIVGPAVTEWRSLDLAMLDLELAVDGHDVHRGRGGHPLGDPLLPLVWLANHLAARGLALAAGHVVTTGSHAGIRYVDAGQRVSARFAGLGEATVSF